MTQNRKVFRRPYIVGNGLLDWHWTEIGRNGQRGQRVCFQPGFGSSWLANLTPIISPMRLQLSDGKNLFGKTVTVSNPSESNNLYAVTILMDVENAAVPINSVTVDTSNPSNPEKGETVNGEKQIFIEGAMDFVGSVETLWKCPLLNLIEMSPLASAAVAAWA